MASTHGKRSGSLAPGVAFVTGGARGLGNAVAVSFAREGARGVAIVDINPETLAEGHKIVESYGTKCLAIQADVTKEEDIERAVAETVKEFGRIDYAANFAGTLSSLTQTHETSLQDFEKQMAVNTTGVFLSTKHELIQMMKQDSIEVEQGRPPQLGAIVNCASVNSKQSMIGTAPYTASKHAVVGITKAAALEARAYNIRVNSVSPGFIRTDLLATVKGASSTGITSGVGNSEIGWEKFEIRQGRRAMVEEIGDVVVLLCSPRMSLVAGENLVVDGGFTVNEAC